MNSHFYPCDVTAAEIVDGMILWNMRGSNREGDFELMKFYIRSAVSIQS